MNSIKENTYEIKEINLSEVNEFLLNDAKLCYQGLSDVAMDYLYHTGSILLESTSKVYGTFKNNILIAYVQVDWWSDICANVHFYLSTHLQHTGEIRKIVKNMRQYVKENTKYTKVITQVPGPCEHVKVAVKAYGMKLEGIITKSIVWRQEPVDLEIYGMDLYAHLEVDD